MATPLSSRQTVFIPVVVHPALDPESPRLHKTAEALGKVLTHTLYSFSCVTDPVSSSRLRTTPIRLVIFPRNLRKRFASSPSTFVSSELGKLDFNSVDIECIDCLILVFVDDETVEEEKVNGENQPGVWFAQPVRGWGGAPDDFAALAASLFSDSTWAAAFDKNAGAWASEQAAELGDAMPKRETSSSPPPPPPAADQKAPMMMMARGGLYPDLFLKIDPEYNSNFIPDNEAAYHTSGYSGLLIRSLDPINAVTATLFHHPVATELISGSLRFLGYNTNNVRLRMRFVGPEIHKDVIISRAQLTVAGGITALSAVMYNMLKDTEVAWEYITAERFFVNDLGAEVQVIDHHLWSVNAASGDRGRFLLDIMCRLYRVCPLYDHAMLWNKVLDVFLAMPVLRECARAGKGGFYCVMWREPARGSNEMNSGYVCFEAHNKQLFVYSFLANQSVKHPSAMDTLCRFLEHLQTAKLSSVVNTAAFTDNRFFVTYWFGNREDASDVFVADCLTGQTTTVLQSQLPTKEQQQLTSSDWFILLLDQAVNNIFPRSNPKDLVVTLEMFPHSNRPRCIVTEKAQGPSPMQIDKISVNVLHNATHLRALYTIRTRTWFPPLVDQQTNNILGDEAAEEKHCIAMTVQPTYGRQAIYINYLPIALQDEVERLSLPGPYSPVYYWKFVERALCVHLLKAARVLWNDDDPAQARSPAEIVNQAVAPHKWVIDEPYHEVKESVEEEEEVTLEHYTPAALFDLWRRQLANLNSITVAFPMTTTVNPYVSIPSIPALEAVLHNARFPKQTASFDGLITTATSPTADSDVYYPFKDFETDLTTALGGLENLSIESDISAFETTPNLFERLAVRREFYVFESLGGDLSQLLAEKFRLINVIAYQQSPASRLRESRASTLLNLNAALARKAARLETYKFAVLSDQGQKKSGDLDTPKELEQMLYQLTAPLVIQNQRGMIKALAKAALQTQNVELLKNLKQNLKYVLEEPKSADSSGDKRLLIHPYFERGEFESDSDSDSDGEETALAEQNLPLALEEQQQPSTQPQLRVEPFQQPESSGDAMDVDTQPIRSESGSATASVNMDDTMEVDNPAVQNTSVIGSALDSTLLYGNSALDAQATNVSNAEATALFSEASRTQKMD